MGLGGARRYLKKPEHFEVLVEVPTRALVSIAMSTA